MICFLIRIRSTPGADSIALLREVVTLVKAHGLELANVDLTVAAQKPELSPWKAQMRGKSSSGSGPARKP